MPAKSRKATVKPIQPAPPYWRSAALPQPPPRAARLACLAFAAGASFAVFFLTLAPTAVNLDSAEFATVAHVPGIAHPTGYPLFALLGKLFDFLPFGTHAFRANLMSACMSACFAGALAWVVMRITSNPVAAAVAALVSAFSRAIWSQSTRAEVYSLYALFISLCIAAFIHWQECGKPRALSLLAFAIGLGLTNHVSLFFVAAPLVLFAAIAHRPASLMALLRAAAWGAAPLVLYLYLPLVAKAAPMSWGCETIEGFFRHVTGHRYQEFAWARSFPSSLNVLSGLWQDLRTEFTLPGLAASALGLVLLFIRNFPLALTTLLGSLAATAWSVSFSAPEVEMEFSWFFLPCYVILVIWLACGAAFAISALARRILRGPPQAFVALLLPALLLAPLTIRLLAKNWKALDESELWEHRDRYALMLHSLKPNAVLLIYSDTATFMLGYLQNVEKVRPDVTVVHHDLLQEQWYVNRIRPRELGRALAAARRAAAISTYNKDEILVITAVNIADRLQGARPVYCMRMPNVTKYQERLLVHLLDIAEVAPPPPDLTVACQTGGIARMIPGVTLVSAQVEPAQVRAGEPFTLRLLWRCEAQVTRGYALLIGSLPAHALETKSPSRRVAITGSTHAWLYGLPAPVTQPGTCYQQKLICMLPSNTQPGDRAIYVGMLTSLREAAGPIAKAAGIRVLP